MKKLILLLLCVFFLASCGQGEDVSEYTDSSDVKESDDGKALVVLDAGHGFADSGCVTEYMQGTESEVTLDIVLRLKTYLEEQGVEVLLTHDGKVYPREQDIISACSRLDIDYRSDLITADNNFTAYERGIYTLTVSKDKQIDLFLSVHVNSFPDDESVDRYELFYCNRNPKKKQVKAFCSALAEELDTKTRIKGYDYEDAYIVTKYGDYPSALFEIGFATNPERAETINSPAWRDALCKTLAQVIFETFEK